ncbi:MAG: DUF1822 family protein [Coleofasciculus sp. S288]|nr:DUF1822 family protein [Coleofasciculus sp. S288]
MTYSTNEIEDFALSLPITQTARRTAQQFANQQPTSEKAEQVRLNTLAVFAVNDYLQMIGVPTDLAVSDSWNPIVRLCANVADLEITGVGRLECRPMGDTQPTCHIPPEVWSDRIGYVVVRIDESSHEATVLGFTPTASREELPISQLEPVEELIDRLDRLSNPAVTPKTRVNLGQWLTDIFETGWQTVESLLTPTEPDLAFSFRSTESSVLTEEDAISQVGVGRAKLIRLGTESTGCVVALVVEVRPQSGQGSSILVQVHPTGNQIYLPSGLQLIVLDETGATFLEAQARRMDNYIQLQFSGQPGEQFSIKVVLEDSSVTEDFVI